MRRRSSQGVLVLVAVNLLLAGCSRASSNQGNMNRGPLRLVGIEYGKFEAANRRVPRDRQEFEKFLRGRLDRLAGYGVHSVDDLLVSPRDGQPLIIVCGNAKSRSERTHWAACEKTGVGGQRMAGDSLGGTSEISEEEFQSVFGG